MALSIIRLDMYAPSVQTNSTNTLDRTICNGKPLLDRIECLSSQLTSHETDTSGSTMSTRAEMIRLSGRSYRKGQRVVRVDDAVGTTYRESTTHIGLITIFIIGSAICSKSAGYHYTILH